MYRNTPIVAVLLIVVALAGACSAPPAAAPPPASPGQPEIAVSTNPNPPNSQAETELVIDVKDASGQPLTGATVNLLADMMGHSMGLMQGQATEQGNGRYAAFVPLSMAGDWKVTVEVRDSQNNLLLRQDVVLPVQ